MMVNRKEVKKQDLTPNLLLPRSLSRDRGIIPDLDLPELNVAAFREVYA